MLEPNLRSASTSSLTPSRGRSAPRGQNVIVDKKFGPPQVNSDGVTIAKEVDLEDPFENMGAQLLKEASKKTNDDAGDGTTTSTVLAQAIVAEGFKNGRARARGADPMAIKRGMEKAMATIRESIKNQSTPGRQLLADRQRRSSLLTRRRDG